MKELSPFEIVSKILNDGIPRTGKEVAKAARELGFDWSRENANSTLYRMLNNSETIKIETEKAPLWTLPAFAEKMRAKFEQPKRNIIKFKSKKLPLSADDSLTIRIQGIEIQFQFDKDLSPNDSYMAGDWLNEKIFVSLNPNHPFWGSFIDSDDKKFLQITNIAAEVYVQWYVSKMTTEISPAKLLLLKDKALRDIALSD